MGAQESKKLWDHYFADALEDTKKTSRIVLDQTWHGTLQGKDATDEMVMRRQLQYSNRNRKLLRRLWDLYDADKSGRLDMKELVVLVTDMLNALFDWLPRMLKSMARDSLHFMKDKFSQPQLKEIKAILDHNLPKMARKIRRWVKQQLENVEDIANQIYEKIDDDGSGYIKMSEFIANFGWSAMEIVNPMEMLSKVERDLYENPDLDDDADANLEDEGANIFKRLRNRHRRRKHRKKRERRRKRQRERDGASSDGASSDAGSSNGTGSTTGSGSTGSSGSKWKFWRHMFRSKRSNSGSSHGTDGDTGTTLSDDSRSEKDKDKQARRKRQDDKAKAAGGGSVDDDEKKQPASGATAGTASGARSEVQQKELLESIDMDALKAEWSEPAPKRSMTMKHA